jgi:hypothetical protein
MSKQSAVLFAVVAAAALTVLTCPRREPVGPPADPDRETPAPPPEHVRVVGTALVTHDLIGGQLTLAEAVARYRELERLAELPGVRAGGGAPVRPGPWSDRTADTDADRLCRRVLSHAEAGVEFEPPDRAAEVFARLAREYLRLRSGGQPLVVPDLPPDQRDAFVTGVRRAAARAAAGGSAPRRSAR